MDQRVGRILGESDRTVNDDHTRRNAATDTGTGAGARGESQGSEKGNNNDAPVYGTGDCKLHPGRNRTHTRTAKLEEPAEAGTPGYTPLTRNRFRKQRNQDDARQSQTTNRNLPESAVRFSTTNTGQVQGASMEPGRAPNNSPERFWMGLDNQHSRAAAPPANRTTSGHPT
jgi:hypothetical protein